MRLDGSMSIRKRMKIVDRFNDPEVVVFSYFLVKYRLQILDD